MPTSFLPSLSTGFCYAVPNLTKLQATRLRNCSASVLISKPSFDSRTNRVYIGPYLTMAASGTKTTAGDLIVDSLISSCGNLTNIALPSGVYFGDRSLRHCQKATLGLKNGATVSRHNRYGSYGFQCEPRSWNSNSSSLSGPWFNGLHTSSVQCYSERVVPTVALDEKQYDEELDNSAVLTEKYALLSIVSYLMFIVIQLFFQISHRSKN